MTVVPSKNARRGVSEAFFRTALEESAGNVTWAAGVVGVSKVHAMRLAEKYGLRAYACELRLSAGGSATGRPCSSEQR